MGGSPAALKEVRTAPYGAGVRLEPNGLWQGVELSGKADGTIRPDELSVEVPGKTGGGTGARREEGREQGMGAEPEVIQYREDAPMAEQRGREH